MPRVHNKYHGTAPADAVYVGRPTKWGNPYSHKDGTLAKYKVASVSEAIAAYEKFLLASPELLASLGELRGRDLVCWCHPRPCHADVLLRLANTEDPDTEERIL